MTPREADIFTCIVDTVVAPGPGMLRVRDTDACTAFDDTLRSAPKLNATGLRALLYVVELAPLAMGERRRMRRLDRDARVRILERLATTRLAPAIEGLRALAAFSYYGDDRITAGYGWHPDEIVARGRALRTAEARW